MSRSLKKGGYFIDPQLEDKIEAAIKADSRKAIRTWSRRSTIIPDSVGLNFEVHDGKSFVPLYVTENMVGHKFGEFAPTRRFKGHNPHTQKQA